MDKLKRLSQVIVSMSLAFSAVIAQQASSWVESQAASPAWLPPVVALAIVSGGSYVLRLVLEIVFESSRWLRRLLLGRQFVEGTWFDLSVEDGQPIIVGVSRVEFSGTTVRFSGEDFAVDGTRQGHYLADLTSLEWPKLKYKYTYHVSDAPQLSKQGYGEAQFIERDGPPKEYVGFYFELLVGKRVTYEGWRVEDPEILAQLDDRVRRRHVIKNFLRPRFEEVAEKRLELSVQPSVAPDGVAAG